MSSFSPPPDFVITKEYRRFAEFCDACRRDRYIGLCYGPPGVGKTLSAQYYANWFRLEAYPPYTFGTDAEFAGVMGSTTVFYTPAVVNSPGRIAQEIQMKRHHLRTLAVEHVYRNQEAQHKAVRPPEFARRLQLVTNRLQDAPPPPPTASAISKAYAHKRQETSDPTDLLMIDETDRLKTTSLEQVRDIFDRGELGLVLIGMPGLEKRLSRYPQLYSRVGFVHAFRPLSTTEVRHLLQEQWLPAGVTLPEHGVTDAEALAAIIRITGGNFRLLHRLLTQIARLMEINALPQVTHQVVEAARESLVIGTM